jgi:hypothetical protein
LTEGSQVDDGGAVLLSGENLTILDSVISNSTSWGHTGSPSFGGCGGNVASSGGTLRIANSLLTGGTADFEGYESGGNLCVFGGQLLLERSTVSGGSAGTGGGIFLLFPAGPRTILHSTISGNHAVGDGGGIFSFGSSLTIDSSTISGNTAKNGGGVWSGYGLQITNSTISGNAASEAGGGITAGLLLLRLTTISNNTAGTEGGSIFGGFVEIDHSIVANGTPQDLIGQEPVTANYSLIENPGTVVPSGANNLIGVDPLLGPLANNGGPTLTHAPLPGSPVLDAGDPAIPSPPATDQRGFGRIVGPAVDLGSVEQQPGLDLAEVPTLSQVGTLVLSVLLLALGVRRLRSARNALP